MTAASDTDAVERLVAQAVEQGFPRQVADEATLERVASLLRAAQADRAER